MVKFKQELTNKDQRIQQLEKDLQEQKDKSSKLDK